MEAGFLVLLCCLQAVMSYRPYVVQVSDYQVNYPTPPPHDEVAKMARYVVHAADWVAIATLSSRPNQTGLPFANIISISDGPVTTSSGVPYMYMTALDLSAQDLKANPHASLTMSLAEGSYCKNKGYDPEDPRCARVMLDGEVEKVNKSSSEGAFAMEALFTRHPEMTTWPADHHWFFAKLRIKSIYLLDYFGGAYHVAVKDYFNVKTEVDFVLL